MKCDDAAKFVSALCDGETIPREAGEHIRDCETCRGRLAEYAQMGAELRCAASAEQAGAAADRDWKISERIKAAWWQRGWETMRIPRLVFALLLVAILALGSSLVMIKARARNQGTVLVLTAKPSNGEAITCALSLVDLKAATCGSFGPDKSFDFRVIAEDGDRIQIGVKVGPGAKALADPATGMLSLDSQPENQYWIVPGQKLEVPVPGTGNLVMTVVRLDHMPPLSSRPDEQLDPEEGELRFVSPVLVRDNEVVSDFGGMNAFAKRDWVVEFYAAGDAHYKISLSPLEGGVQGNVEMGRVTFKLKDESYMFLLAAPATREQHVWILRDANYSPPAGHGAHGFLGTDPIAKAAVAK